MNTATDHVEPPLHFNMSAKVSDNTQIHVATTSLEELSKVIAMFNLVSAPAADKPADKPAKKPKAEAASTAATPAATPAEKPAAAASAPAASTGSGVTQAQAAEAVRAYGAKNGIDKARELLKRHGFEKTADITAEKADALHAEAVAEEL